MVLKLSNRSNIESFRALENLREVNERTHRGEDIIRLEAGQPCFGVPKDAIEYAGQMMNQDPIQGYTDAIGMISLRERISGYYNDHYDCEAESHRIAITTGSSCGFILAFLAAFNAGDRIALTTPTYAAYRSILKSLDLEVVTIETTAETGFQPTAELLENCAERFDGIIINSPSNPTGEMIAEDELQKICAWCDENGVRLVSDEAYHGVTYEQKATSVLKYSKTAIVLNTFSKYFAMTGWRMGWLVVPDDMADRIKKLAENLYVSPPTISQHVAYKVFDHMNELDTYVTHYQKNRDILKAGLPDAGLDKLSATKGAFYIYADISEMSNDSMDFTRRMLDEAKVCTTSGLDFDPARGHDYIRISYAGTPEDMTKACKRIKDWLA